MSREEAIKIIKECKEKGFKYTFYTLNEYDEALDMAIKALEQEPCEKCCGGNQEEKATLCQKSYLAGMEHKTKQEPCEDCINRQAAIDAMMKWIK